MIFKKNLAYFQEKVRIDKASNKSTAYKIQVYNDAKMDSLVKAMNEGETGAKPSPAVLGAELAIILRPEVYKNYNRIINSKYTSNDAMDKMLVKNKANKDLERIVNNEVERIAKNLDYVEKVMQKYNIPQQQYEQFKKEQANKSYANRKQVLEKVAIKANELLVSEGLNIPSSYSYYNLEASAENMLRQSQMQSKHEEINAINQNYIDEGKDAVYTGKEWIWTGAGATTRHASNDHQKREINEPFIIVNDNTLEIDELMYPSDPDGSPSNTYICYCEIEYLTDYGETTPVDLSEPLVPEENILNSPVDSLALNPLQFMDVKPKGEVIDTAEIEYTSYESEYTSKEYWLDESNGAFINEAGNWEYKGLEADEAGGHNSFGKFKAESIAKHNYEINNNAPVEETTNNIKFKLGLDKPIEQKISNEVEYAGEPIDLNKFDSKGQYLVNQKYDDVTFNENTGKWEYKGLEVKDYSEKHDIGTVYLTDAIEHNKKLGVEPEEADVQVLDVEPKVIKTDSFYYDEDIDAYTILDHEGILDVNGKKIYNGLDITSFYNYSYQWADVPVSVIEAHNKSLGVEPEKVTVQEQVVHESKAPEKEIIDLNDYEIEDGNIYINLESYAKVHQGEFYHKGLKINDFENSPYGEMGVLPVEEVIKHNQQIEALEKKPIDTDIDSFLISTHGGMYGVVEDAPYIAEVNGEHYYKGLKLEKGNEGFKYGLSEEAIKEHNLKLSSNEGLTFSDRKVHKQSNILREAKDNVTGDNYAVDENGRKWVLDRKAKYEKKQDALQNQVDMTEQYDAVHSWGGGGYRKINQFNYNKGRFDKPIYREIRDAVHPILNEIRSKASKGQSTKALEKKLDKVIEKYKNDERTPMGKYNEVFKVIEEIRDIDIAQAKAPPLEQDTCFIRAGAWKIDFNKIGEIFEWDGFAGISYRERPVDLGHESLAYNITILAPKGTRGVRLSNQFDALVGEREWLLARGQKFRVLEFNENAQPMPTCTIELIVEDF